MSSAGYSTGVWRGVRRSDAAVARVVRSWRGLTGGAKTLVACSGGADSVGLLLMLRAATEGLVVGHVVHDLRAKEEAEGDRDFVRGLAGACGLAFVSESVTVPRGNAEGEARRVRYGALARMAAESGCGFVASGHHAGDQFEGVVMALVRGAGVRGLGAAREKREIVCEARGARAVLVRPALRVERGELEKVCSACGVAWRTDVTNFEEGRVRADLRNGALAEIEALRPGAAGRAARSAEVLRDAAGLIEDRAQEVFGEEYEWEREALRAERAVVVAAGLRGAYSRLTQGNGLDRIDGEMVEKTVAAVRDSSGEGRVFAWGGVRVSVEKAKIVCEFGS